MRIALMLAVLALVLPAAGCGYTRYHVTKPDGTVLSVLSTREFPDGIVVEYESEQGARLKIDAGSVKAHESTTSAALVQALLRVLSIPAAAPVATEPPGQ